MNKEYFIISLLPGLFNIIIEAFEDKEQNFISQAIHEFSLIIEKYSSLRNIFHGSESTKI